MRKAAAIALLTVFVTLFAGLDAGPATAGVKKLVEGTLYETTCGAACTPCPPPCGPPPPIAQSRHSGQICAQQANQIVCPLIPSKRDAVAPAFCIEGQPCGVDYPVYSGEGAVVHVRKRGSSTVLATLPVVEGHFKLRLAPGEYVIHPYLPEPQCWQGTPAMVKVTAKMKSPVPVSVDVGNSCVAQPEVGG